jgi:hypothetical protein
MDAEEKEDSRGRAHGFVGLLLVVLALSAAWVSPTSQTCLEATSRENANLVVRQQALRQVAFALANEAYRQVEHDRRALSYAGQGDPRWAEAQPPPPLGEADNAALLAWLSEQTARIRTLPFGSAAWP